MSAGERVERLVRWVGLRPGRGHPERCPDGPTIIWKAKAVHEVPFVTISRADRADDRPFGLSVVVPTVAAAVTAVVGRLGRPALVAVMAAVLAVIVVRVVVGAVVGTRVGSLPVVVGCFGLVCRLGGLGGFGRLGRFRVLRGLSRLRGFGSLGGFGRRAGGRIRRAERGVVHEDRVRRRGRLGQGTDAEHGARDEERGATAPPAARTRRVLSMKGVSPRSAPIDRPASSLFETGGPEKVSGRGASLVANDFNAPDAGRLDVGGDFSASPTRTIAGPLGPDVLAGDPPDVVDRDRLDRPAVAGQLVVRQARGRTARRANPTTGPGRLEPQREHADEEVARRP